MERFNDIRPMTCKDVSCGCEPSLYDVLMRYYMSHDICRKDSEKFTANYIKKWLKIEKELN